MMKANDSFEKIMEWILSADSIALAGHLNPDGDAIGACLAPGTIGSSLGFCSGCSCTIGTKYNLYDDS